MVTIAAACKERDNLYMVHYRIVGPPHYFKVPSSYHRGLGMQRARIYVSDPTERCMGTGKFGKGKDLYRHRGTKGTSPSEDEMDQ